MTKYKGFLIGFAFWGTISLLAFKYGKSESYTTHPAYDIDESSLNREEKMLAAEERYKTSLHVKFDKNEKDTAHVSDSEIAIFSVHLDTLIKFKK